MKGQFVAELVSGDPVDTVVCLRSRDLRLSRRGEPYLWLELSDRSGVVQAVRFGPGALETTLPEGSVARVRGSMGAWRGESRLRVSGLEAADTYDRRDLLPVGTADIDDLKDRFRAHVAAVRDKDLRALIHAVFAPPGLARRFADCPGSAGHDHAWLGGLMEHTVTVCTLARALAAAYPQADQGLLLAAAVLHDIGRVDELEFETAIGTTLEGRLSGHLLLGLRKLDRAVEAAGAGIPRQRLVALRHAIATHHARPGDEPATLEALLLSQADRTDREAIACVTAVGQAIRGDRAWTGVDNPLGRALLADAGRAGAWEPAEESSGVCAAVREAEGAGPPLQPPLRKAG